MLLDLALLPRKLYTYQNQSYKNVSQLNFIRVTLKCFFLIYGHLVTNKLFSHCSTVNILRKQFCSFCPAAFPVYVEQQNPAKHLKTSSGWFKNR